MASWPSGRAWSPLPAPGSRMLVTGSAGGLGGAVVDALLDLGCGVVGVDRVEPRDGVDRARHLVADLADPGQAAEAVRSAGEVLGGLDGVVGAAGVVDTIHRAATFPAAVFDSDLRANLSAQFHVVQAAHALLCNSSAPSVVLFSSVAAFDGLPGQLSYAAAKAGVIGLVRSLAAEWAPRRIRVNAVAPGMVATPKVLAMPGEIRDRMLATVPFGRVAALNEVVGTVLYLLSPAAGYTTGQVLRMDGGQGLATAGLYR